MGFMVRQSILFILIPFLQSAIKSRTSLANEKAIIMDLDGLVQAVKRMQGWS